MSPMRPKMSNRSRTLMRLELVEAINIVWQAKGQLEDVGLEVKLTKILESLFIRFSLIILIRWERCIMMSTT